MEINYISAMISHFVSGLIAYFRALGFMSKKGVGKYFVYSGLIGIILFGVCVSVIYNISPLLSGFIQELTPWDIDLSIGFSNFFSYAITSIAFLGIFKYLMLIFTAPVMSALSERVEREVTGMVYDKNIAMSIIPDIMRSLRINLRNIIREVFLTILLLIAGLVPIVGAFSAILILLVQGYFAGFGNFDFWAERHFDYSNTVRFMKPRKLMLTANGLPYVFLIAIPVLGAFIGPPLATIAATLEGVKELERYDDY